MQVKTTSLVANRSLARALRRNYSEFQETLAQLPRFPLPLDGYDELCVWFSDQLDVDSTRHQLLDDSEIFSVEVGIEHATIEALTRAFKIAIHALPCDDVDGDLVATWLSQLETT